MKYGDRECRHAEYIKAIEARGLVNNIATFISYLVYIEMCAIFGEEPYFTKIGFSRFCINHLGYVVKDKKVNNTKYRVFRKKTGA
jgi:hypothetical protein